MRFSLTARILIGGGIVAVVFVLQFVLSIGSFRTIRHDTREEQRSNAAVLAAVRVEKLILDLETGTRGYALTGDRRFLQPYLQARQALPAQSKELIGLAPGATAKEVDREWRSYITDYAVPLIKLTSHSPATARAETANGEGKRRVDRMRALIDPFVAHASAVAARDRSSVSKAVNSGVSFNLLGAALRALAFAAIVVYLLRYVVRPIRRISSATVRVSAGDLDVTVPEQGPGEIGELARSFNTMAASLVRQQQDLATQNVDLERLANVLRAVLDSTVDGILLSDADGNVQLANRPVLNLTRDLGMSYEGPVVDRLLSVGGSDQGSREVPRGDGAPALEPERVDVRRVRGHRQRPCVPGLHGAGPRRPRRRSSGVSGRCAR